MLLKINRFLSSDALSLKVNENFIIDDEEFLQETQLQKDISLTGEIYKVDDSVSLVGSLKYKFSDECARCLKEFDNIVETNFNAIIVQKEDTESDEIQLVTTDGNIKMDETIKQLIHLSMPMKSLCDKDCKGICPNCGANLNMENCQCENNTIDPRFSKLKDLLKN